MSEELKYYENELKLMADSVKTCDIVKMFESTEFFITEANTRMSGIDDTVRDRISYFRKKFKENCVCTKK